MFRFPSVICTRCTGFFCLAIIKGPPNDIYCIIEEPSKHYFTEKVSYSLLQIMTYILQKDFWGRALRYSLLFYEIMADMQRKYSIILFFLILTMEPGSTVLQIRDCEKKSVNKILL